MIKSIGFRLSLWYSVFFIVSVTLLLVWCYFFFTSTIKKIERDTVLLEIDELAVAYEQGGLELVQKEIEVSQKNHSYPFFIRIANSRNQTLLILPTQSWNDFDLASLDSILPKENSQFIILPSRKDSFKLEIASRRLRDMHWLQVGLSSAIRIDIIAQFRRLFIMIVIPLLAFGFLSGSILSNHALKPIRDMIQTVRSIDRGEMNARVKRSHSSDELDELAKIFNEMLDRISNLIKGMKNSLDNVAHDLRTPLTRLKNISEKVLQSSDNQTLCFEALADCIEESDRIIQMINMLMNISEAEAGVLNLEFDSIKISQILNRIIDMYQFVAEEKQIELNLLIHNDVEIPIDKNRMSQAIANLIDNAIKYTPRQGKIDISVTRQNENCVIKISDNGMGITEEDLPKIWNRLFRSEHSLSEKGLGLGLSFVKAIIQAHNGSISVESKFKYGADFICRIPISCSSANS